MKRNKHVIYVSGKYANGHTELETRDENIELARSHAINLWNMGFAVICPHSNSSKFESDKRIAVTFEDILEGELEMINYVDALFMIPNWKNSQGAKIEHDYAFEHQIPILYGYSDAERFLKYNTECDSCGLTRGLTPDFGGKFCDRCYEAISQGVAHELGKRDAKFIPIPRDP